MELVKAITLNNITTISTNADGSITVIIDDAEKRTQHRIADNADIIETINNVYDDAVKYILISDAYVELIDILKYDEYDDNISEYIKTL